MLCGYIRDDEEKIIWFFFRRERERWREIEGERREKFWFFFRKERKKDFFDFLRERRKRDVVLWLRYWDIRLLGLMNKSVCGKNIFELIIFDMIVIFCSDVNVV